MAVEFNPGGASSLNDAVKLRYEANGNTNAFTDDEKSKLAGVATGATAGASWDEVTDKPTTFAPIIGTDATQAMAGNTALLQIGTSGTTAAAGNSVVNLTTAQTVAGIKTFSAIPVLPATDPTTDNQAVRKAYVDGLVNPTNVTITASSTVANTVPSGTKFYSTSATGTTQTLAPDAAVGKTLVFFQTAAGPITLAAGAGETLNVETGFDPISRGAGTVISAEKVNATQWLVYGALATSA